MTIDRWPERVAKYFYAKSIGWILLLALILTASSLFGSFALDDIWLRDFFHGRDGLDARAPYDLFAFVRTPRDFSQLQEIGLLPWFASPDLRIAFFRPLASLSHALDFWLFPGHPWLMHLQNIGLYAGLVLILAKVYRRFMGTGIAATFAVLLYAFDEAHGISVGWISNRSALGASIFALGSLLFHDRWRTQNNRWAAYSAVASLALGLLSAEFALGVGAYLFAYALILDPAPRSRALLSLWPYAAVVGLWAWVYHRMGYGASAATYYLDPLRDAGGYFSHLPDRTLSLLASQLAWPSADIWLGLSRWQILALTAFRMAALVLFACCVWPLLRRDKSSRFFALGMVISVLPVASTQATDRVLFLIGVGGFALVARLLLAENLYTSDSRWPRIIFVNYRRALLLVHLILAPLLLPLSSVMTRIIHDSLLKFTALADPRPAFAKQTLILLATPSIIMTNYRWAFAPEGFITPQRTRALAFSAAKLTLTREDRRTLLVSGDEPLIQDPFANLFRDEEAAMKVGDRIEVAGLRYEVRKVNANGQVLALRCRFEEDLESPSYRWLGWDGTRYEKVEIPRLENAMKEGHGI